MSLKIIYGRSGSGKTNECYNLIEKVKNNSQIIFMVPEQYSLSAEREISNRYGYGSLSKIDILSFERMAQRVFSTVGPAMCSYIDNAGKQMIMEKALMSVEKNLTIFSKAVKNDDFPLIILDTINELKRHNISSEMLRNCANMSDNVMFKFKMLDIALIYDQYNKAFILPISDSEDNMSMLSDKINQHSMFCDAHIILDSYESFAPNQLTVIEQLLKNALSVTVTLTLDSLEPPQGSDVFKRAKNTAIMLYDIAIKNNIEVLPNVYKNMCFKYCDNIELMHLEENYFKYPPLLYNDHTNNINIFTAGNYYGEIENVAKEILSLCRDKNYRFKDIAVITRDLSTYAPLVKSIFNEYNILYHLDEKLSALNSPFTYGVLSLFEIVIHNYSYESMFRWVKSDFCDINRDQAYLLENYVLAVGNLPKMWQKDDEWTFLSQFSESQLSDINNIKNTVRKPLVNFVSKFSGRKTTKQIATAFAEFLDEIKADEKATLDKTSAQVYNYIVDVLNQMVNILGETNLTFEKFYNILSAGLSGCEIGVIPATVDEVQISTIDRFKGQSAKCVFIIGVTDGVFPCGYISEGILSERDRTTLSSFDMPGLENISAKHNDENYLIYSAITSALEKLYFYYPTADNEGKSLNPSTIINRLRKIFPYISEKNNIYISEDYLADIEGVLPTFNKMISEDESGFWQQVEKWYEQNYPKLYFLAQNSKKYTNLPDKLRKETVNALYGILPSSSISRAEQFSKCNFAYFMKYGLYAKERKENKIEAVDVGSFMHEIIEKFSIYAETEGWKNIDKAICDAKTAEITTEVLNKYLSEAYTSSPRYLHLFNKIKRIMSMTVWNISEYYKQSSFVPLGYELEFSKNGGFPEIEIVLENGNKVNLVGKIDRADIWRTDKGDFISIVDYKSSHKDIDFSEVLCGIQLQLPTYINAVCKSLGEKNGVNPMPAAMMYYKIDYPVVTQNRDSSQEEINSEVRKQLKMRGLSLESEEVANGIGTMFMVKSQATAGQIDRLCKTAHKQLSKAIDGILQGDININPARYSGKTSCDYCPYGSICSFDTNLKDNKYRNIKKFSREEFFEYVGDVD